MSAIPPIAAPDLAASAPLITQIGLPPAPTVSGAGFADVLAAGMRQMDAKVATADALVRRFALGDAIPVHQVTYALEEARLSVELAMQVRGRLVESYRDLMNMQL